MAERLTFRPEQVGDEPRIFNLVARAFPSDAEASLVDNVRRSRRLTLSLVAVEGNEILGHIAFSPVTLNGEQIYDRQIGWGLAPVATAPERQRQGIAARLIELGLELAKRSGVRTVVVLGSPAYYSRFGFQPARLWNLRDEYQGGDAFQALELIPGSFPAGRGLIQYAPEFGVFG